jgi:AraC-like DNA-binding protein
MNQFADRLTRIERVGFFMAPENARLSPAQIPEDTELVELLTSGEVFFEVDGQKQTFGKGTIFWHQSGEKTIYQTTPEAPYRCAVFHFSVRDRNRPAPRVSFWNPKADVDAFVSECLSLFHTRELPTDALTLYTYGTLLRHALANKNSRVQGNRPEPLDRALGYIERHLGEKILIARLAEYSRVSQPQLFRLVQTHLGPPPHRHIIARQLARARTMLAGTPLPIKAIASKCGFESLEVFYRRFRSEGGLPPGEYRRQNQPYRFPEQA